MAYIVPSDQEKIFLSHIGDMILLANKKNIPKFSSFLDERQQLLAEEIVKKTPNTNYSLFGGYENSGRRVFGVFSAFSDCLESLFPITAITVRFRVQDTLTHRDFLGALMALKITRESIGDILVGEGMAVLFVLNTVSGVILEELDKVGRIGISCTEGLPEHLPSEQRFMEISGTVSSFRLDCMVAMVTSLSREKASKLIGTGLVTVNHQPIFSNGSTVCEKDILSIRGYGKFAISAVGKQTKKGRFHIVCLKYI